MSAETLREAENWRDLLRDHEAWNAATQTLDAAEEARDYLSETIMRIDQQFADNRTMGRLPDDEWSDHLDWRAAASGFKRVCSVRKRELDRRIKQLNREQSEREREEYLSMRARLDREAMAEAWDEGYYARGRNGKPSNPYRTVTK